jgi:multidrug resistance efflux pump
MPPAFRTDLTASREEQQGVVFYRIDDPKTQTSFRLYEIEYLIAQKLDGKRALPQVMAAVKEEYNFDISEQDLKKFVDQLDSMGFIMKDGEAPAAINGDAETQVMKLDQVRQSGPDDLELAEPDLVEDSGRVDDTEIRRLLKSALLHVKQGYIVHARDYFLAAKELAPADTRLQKLVSHLEIMGDASGPAEVEYLWNQSRELFPDIAAEVGPLIEAKGGGSIDSPQAASPGIDEDLKARVIWTLVVLVLVLGGGSGLYFFAKEARIFEGAPRARISAMTSTRVPVYIDGGAESVGAAREAWLSFATGGKVAEVLVAAGARVSADQPLLKLQLPPPVEKQLKGAKAAVVRAEADYEKAAKKLEKLVVEREKLEAQRANADEKLKELKPKSLRGGGVSKRDLDKYKKELGEVMKALSNHAKRERGPRKDEGVAKARLAKAKKQLETFEAKVAQKVIRAPFAGVVQELQAAKNDAVTPQKKIVLLRDTLSVRLAFLANDAVALQPGGEAFVSVARGTAIRAKVSAVQPAGDGKRIEVLLADPTGAFVDTPLGEFRLVREFVDPAFEIPVTAIVQDKGGTHVLVELQGRALIREVEVLQKDASNAIIRDRSGALRDGEHLVVERIGEGGVATIVDGSFLEVEK